MTSKESLPPTDEVYLEEHGIPGTLGKPAGWIDVVRYPDLLKTAMWIENPSRASDLHVGFRASFTAGRSGPHRFRVQASSVFRVWLDGEVILHGPLRFAPSLPEYHDAVIEVSSGSHVLCIEAHHEGIMHRTTAPLPGFVLASLDGADAQVKLDWRARELTHYGQTGLRVSPLLGWMETHSAPGGDSWRDVSDDDPGWRAIETAHEAVQMLGTPTPSGMTLPQWTLLPMKETGRGVYSDTFAGYDLDDPAIQFLLADDTPASAAAVDGFWFRYDLECVRVGSVELEVELECAGTIIIGYAERLTPDLRPSPVVAMSAGPTRMIQQYTVGAGVTQIVPLQSLGGRYIEVRIETPGTARVRHASFRERDYLGAPTGSFTSDDEVLNDIWTTGLRTLRSSTEDAVIDSVRERGEWLGDVVSAAHLIMQSGWGEVAPIRRALLHAAAGAREDGLVAGCGPGELIYLGTYAAQWIEACLRVAATEDSPDILRQLLEPGRANMTAIISSVREDGTTGLPWGFVDWGYAAPADGVDVAVLAHVVMAVRHWVRWLMRLELSDEASLWQEHYLRLAELLRPAVETSLSPYHAYTLGYHAGVVTVEEAVPHIRKRFENGFPFDPIAPRLKNPTKADSTAVTPYFTNYSMPILLEAGLGHEVRRLWHDGWGWMLAQGATTWWEVFDERWSRCHAWSGAPSWQLSQHTLGLRAATTSSPFRVAVNTLGLDRASGRIPLGRAEVATVEWKIRAGALSYTISSSVPLTIRVGDQTHFITAEPTEFMLTRVTGDLYE